MLNYLKKYIQKHCKTIDSKIILTFSTKNLESSFVVVVVFILCTERISEVINHFSQVYGCYHSDSEAQEQKSGTLWKTKMLPTKNKTKPNRTSQFSKGKFWAINKIGLLVLIHHSGKKKKKGIRIQNQMDLMNSSQSYIDCFIFKIFLLRRNWL